MDAESNQEVEVNLQAKIDVDYSGVCLWGAEYDVMAPPGTDVVGRDFSTEYSVHPRGPHETPLAGQGCTTTFNNGFRGEGSEKGLQQPFEALGSIKNRILFTNPSP